jgi:tetratricopeptide (TPR) repeat protein
VDELSDKAQQAMAAKDWPTAAPALEKLAQLTPRVAEVQANLGLAYYSLNRIAEAAPAFERALKLNPRMAQARLLLGLCEAELGRSDEAVKVLEPAFARPPDDELGRLIGFDLERAYTAQRRNDKAMSVAEELARRYPNDPEVLFHVSKLLADRSYQLMSRLLRLAPDGVWAHYALAEVHLSQQKYDFAMAEYRKVLEMSPRLPGIHFQIGRCFLARSKEPASLDAALSEFRQELETDPRNAEAEYEIGEIQRERGEFASALEHFQHAVRDQAGFAEAEIGLGRTLNSLGRVREAMQHFEAAAKADPENPAPHFLLASAYRALGASARQQQEMALFQKLRSATRPAAEGLVAPSRITEQTLGNEWH